MGAADQPVTECVGCGEKKPTYRVGATRTDRACGPCIRNNRVPAIPAGDTTSKGRRA